MFFDDIHLLPDKVYESAESPWGIRAFRFIIMSGENAVGTISFRPGNDFQITHLAGHIGFEVNENFRGQSLAGKAVRALMPLVIEHRISPLYFTTTPDNHSARRVFEKLGCILDSIVDIPQSYDSYARGERVKLRYRLEL